ncbi:ly-6/neurotoxin-like protein 1 [Notolabrus celidotus]|uniref:ly-6/neurotoxin-like protein 1 n=1 Tax=Notolabrus celidotus TaxID=1203425 RepID=UPI00148FEF34|nr:ly-6/neurotoxin-like protein 1 [Notolabrus celidotus]
MNKLLWCSATLLTVFVTVDSLTCYTCNGNAMDSCLIDSPVNCTTSQTSCYIGVTMFSTKQQIYSRGCTKASTCEDTVGSILDVTYTVTMSCCSTDLCNRAASSKLPLTAALCAALGAVWSQWGL